MIRNGCNPQELVVALRWKESRDQFRPPSSTVAQKVHGLDQHSHQPLVLQLQSITMILGMFSVCLVSFVWFDRLVGMYL